MDISDYSPAADARRFDAGTPPVPNIYAGLAGMSIIEEAGTAAIEEHIAGLAARLIDGLEELGATVATPRDPARRGPLVCVALDRRAARSSPRSPRRRSSARSATRTCASRSTSTTSRRTSTGCSTRCARTARCSRNRIVSMLLRELDYARPGSVEEAVEAPRRARGRARARRRAEPRQRDEDAGRRARARRRPEPDRRAARDRGRRRRAR